MALHAGAADVPQRGDIYFVDPFEVEIRTQLRGNEKPTNDEIVKMAISLCKHGQRRAVECRERENGHMLLAHGCIRTLAARLICSGFEYIDPETLEAVRVKDKKFKLKVVLDAASTQ